MAGRKDSELPWIPANFLALPPHQSDLSNAGAILIPVPCDSTTSVRSGARLGPAAILEASYALEDYDWELDQDVSPGRHSHDSSPGTSHRATLHRW